ncbi:MAG: 16S rRNA (guanine(527)-N(7))-methyltransferase RsmG [Christensenellaceae bacterium]|jgi:16S rRNA (guanine527-N7)-methyltransferase|nr:16S rRNA (guanine(527)-N(7))-methyltransferase RsmG [Christensenellaceae bacterium]
MKDVNVDYLNALDVFKKKLAQFGLTGEQLNTFVNFSMSIQRLCGVINLTSLKSNEDFAVKHFADSLLSSPCVTSGTLIDIGCGAGFPGIPLAVANDKLHVTLLDSSKKKIDFLASSVKDLEIKNCSCVVGRAETLGRHTSFREQFNFVTMRAVASLRILIELAMPFLFVGGKLIAYKSANVDSEILDAKNTLSALNCEIESVPQFTLDGRYSRSLILIVKKQHTSSEFPRAFNKMKSAPL